jgi:hypothetical protein
VDVDDMLFAALPVLVLVGLFLLAALWISRRARMREWVHRERIAMIEKGLVPPSELYAGEARRSVLETMLAADPPQRPSHRATQFRSAGVMFIGLGVALALIIGVTAGKPNVGLGLGGAIVALGAAMIVNAVLTGREAGDSPRRARDAGSPTIGSESPGGPKS